MGLYGGPLLDTMMFPTRGSSLILSTVYAATGDTIAVPLTALMIQDLASVTMQVLYNESWLDFVGARTASASLPLSLSYSDFGGGIIRLTLTGSQGVTADSVRLIEVLFAARELHGATSITFQQAECNASNLSLITIQELVNGQVLIGPASIPLRVNLPVAFSLLQNYPNPFNPSTTIRYDLPMQVHATLKVYNVLGQEVATLVNQNMSPGTYDQKWNATNAASGVYFYRLTADDFVETKKMLLLR
jgi:hypothetical protein